MAPRANDKDARVQRERARVYQARLELNQARGRRRTRDNVVGGIVGAVLLLGLLGAQIAYYTAGPGKPAPAPSPTTTSTVLPAPTLTPTPTTTP
ncbi:dioxygenase [Microbacterium protaetiae]|uniref:Dioxygenase n=1 Tax=Microbacterium protaetiae TaxID=2509458 RepID=A0A4P6EM07_9MICO|nr:dioxygenase [Microbacterium protaetiae]QAY61267.1 dioxygenase [Microbacterium protaetiae]